MKPKRKTVEVRLPRDIDNVVRFIAKQAGTTPTVVMNVLLVIGLMKHKPDAPVPDPARRPPAR